MSNPPFSQWRDDAADATFSPPADCRKRADKFGRQIRIRNAIEYGAGALVCVLFGASGIAALIKGELLIALSMALIVIGACLIVWSLHRRASNLVRQPEEPCLEYLRRQYRRQFDALNAVPKWYIGPLLPGVAMLYLVITAKAAEKIGWTAAFAGIAEPLAITAAVFGAVALANWYAARSLKRKLNSLDGLSA